MYSQYAIDRKLILHSKTFLNMDNSQNAKFRVLISPPTKAHTEHMLATSLWRPRANDEIAPATIIKIIFIAAAAGPPNQWLNIDFAANGLSALISWHMHCQIQLVGSRFLSRQTYLKMNGSQKPKPLGLRLFTGTSTHRAHVSKTHLTTSSWLRNCPRNNRHCCCCSTKSMIENWFCRKFIFNNDFTARALSNTIGRKSILPSQMFMKMNSSQNQKCWVAFPSPAPAHTEHMLATRFWRTRGDDEVAHTTIIMIITIIVAVAP